MDDLKKHPEGHREEMMNIPSVPIRCWLLIIIAVQILTGPAWAEPVDNRLYAQLLKRHVHQGEVNYKGFKAEEEMLDQYLAVLGRIDPDTLADHDQFAFYVNAYNAWTIKLILSAYPNIKSIKDLSTFLKSPWKKAIAAIDGKTLTLDNIEHDILRPTFHDPRVHFVINCASKSCPPLVSEPYEGKRLQQQLEDATLAFINDRGANYFKKGTLYVSSIFKWFKADFNNDIVGFFRHYARGDLKESLATHEGPIAVEFLKYDWRLNGH